MGPFNPSFQLLFPIQVLRIIGRLFSPKSYSQSAKYVQHALYVPGSQILYLSFRILSWTAGYLGYKTTCHHQGRRQRGSQWCPAPPFEIGASHFTFGPLVAAYIQYCIFKMWPPFWFLAPLSGFCPPAAKSWRRAWPPPQYQNKNCDLNFVAWSECENITTERNWDCTACYPKLIPRMIFHNDCM